MFKRIFFMLSLLVFVICGQTGYAYGTNVALNDTITADGFEKSFNAVDAGDLSYVKLSKVEQRLKNQAKYHGFIAMGMRIFRPPMECILHILFWGLISLIE